MANFNKSFNFRGGFQVDESTFIVRGGTVGIGSTIPKSRLDVDGTITAKGLDISSEAVVGIESANVGFLSATTINVGVASISAGIITATSPAGIVTYYGDARFLQGLPTSQWLDIDVGLGYTSIYAAGNVGVDTTDPRYPFQVGGVPFPTTTGPALPAQDGVGIDRGNIYASGIVSTRGEFVGLGSNITAIDGGNITVGAIGSMAYGPLIVTTEVIADKFTGIASTAISVTPDATLEFDTATANEITAIDRFLSAEGRLQIGDNEDNANVGDIQVRKSTGQTRIYSIAENSSARIFVGNERPGGSANGYGGIRFGGFSGDISGVNDLDVVNYDIGDINFYVNAGVAATTDSRFNFINGQNDRILAHIDQQGSLTLEGSADTYPTLVVAGVSSLTDVSVASSITSDAVYTDSITASGDVNVNGTINVSDPVFVGVVTATQAFVAGTDPTLSLSAGVKLTSGGDIFANFGGIFLGSSGSEYFTVNSSGDVTAKALSLTDSLSADSATLDTLDATTLITGPNSFSLSSTGLSVTDLSATTGSVTNLTATGTVDATTVEASTLDVGTNTITTAGATFNGLTVNGPLTGTFTSLPGGITFNGDIAATNASFTSVTSSSLSTPSIDSSSASISILKNTLFSGSISAPSGSITALASDTIAIGNYITFNGFRLSFNVDTGADELSITINDSSGIPVGEAVIAYIPD
jgi:hypothetical protein